MGSSLRIENVREVTFSTFRTPESVSSLLPPDQLFEKGNRPSPTDSVLSSVILGSRGSSKIDIQDETLNLASIPGKSRSNLLQSIAPIVKKEVVEEQVTDFYTKPTAGLSFTERLAAKKNVSRKIPCELESRPPSSNEPDPSDNEKKHVQFDLDSKQIRHYTPECSEETKVTESSNSSEDFLDFIGDPQLLQPLNELTYPMKFEEKRWDVSFTSFGLASSPNGSPVKVPPAVNIHLISPSENDEMVTKFNSEYCPSPLSATSEEADVPVDQSNAISSPQNSASPVPEERNEPNTTIGQVLQLDIVSNIPAAIESSKSLPDQEVKSQSIMLPSGNSSPLPQSPDLKLQISSPITNHAAFTAEPCELPSLPINESTEAEVKALRVSHAVHSAELVKTDENFSKAQSVELSRNDRLATLARGVARVESIEERDSPVLSSAIKDYPNVNQRVCNSPQDAANEFSNPSNRTDNVNVTNLDTDSISSNVDLALTPPPPVQQQTDSQEIIQSNNKEVNTVSSQKLPHQDLLRMKEEMQAALESEKKRLEDWFSQEIAQLKTSNILMVQQFESELANERRRTEDLSKLVESAKEEKEELTRREILRLEETLAHLVEEKNRQAELSVTPAATLSQSAIQHRQDAHVQTEEINSVSTNKVAEKHSAVPDEESKVSIHSPVNNRHFQYNSNSESQMSAEKRELRKKCHCDTLQRQVARVEREMQLLKQKNIAFQKNPASAGRAKKSAPVKAKRESWWVDSDESTTSTVSSVSEKRFSKVRSRSLTNLHTAREVINDRKSTPHRRPHDLHNRSRSRRKMVTYFFFTNLHGLILYINFQWMDDQSDQSDALTSGVGSAYSTGEWDTVLNSINKISGDLRQVWSHIGERPRSSSCLPSKSKYSV